MESATKELIAQCDINASASATTITCDQGVSLSAFGSSTGQIIIHSNRSK